MDMQYRRLGRSGLQVSVLSFGSWVTFGPQLDEGLGAECLTAAHEAGVNFYDNAEGYEAGKSETIMGKAIARNGWPRHSYVVSTKLFWGIHNEPNMKNTLNRNTGALRPRLRRPPLLPPGRSDHTDRRDGVGHVRHRELG
jgi:aryl-alcohol dehydrogenase-like predicted oxidoreductase